MENPEKEAQRDINTELAQMLDRKIRQEPIKVTMTAGAAFKMGFFAALGAAIVLFLLSLLAAVHR